MQMPKFTKIATDGHPAYRFELGDKPYEAYRYASGAGAWNVDAIEGDKRRTVVTGKNTRAAAVTDAANAERETRLDQLADDVAQMKMDADELLVDMRTVGAELGELQQEVAEWGAEVDELTEQQPTATAEPVVFFVEIDRHVQARPRVFEDRYRIHQRGLADPIERFAVPYRGDRNDGTTLAFRGWKIVGEVDYVAGLNVFRARVERTPVEYGNAGHWISAHVVDPDADRPDERRYVAQAKCGAYLIATYDTPRGHALCVACTGDPVEVTYLRDREGWLKDGGRPVKVLRALSYRDRIIASTVTTDAKGSEREWHDVRVDARASEIDFAPEADARPGLRQTCLNALCTKDYGHTRRDGDECGNVFTTAGGGGQRPTPVAPLDGPRVGERVKYAVGRHTVHATVTRLANDGGQVGVVDNGDQTGSVRYVAPTLLTVHTPDLDDLHGAALEENRLRDAMLKASAPEAPEPRRTETDEPVPGTLVDPHTWLRRPAEPCKHGFRRRPDAKLTIRCEFGHEYGVFGDEGPIYRADCAVQAANEAARYTVEDDGDTTYEVAIVCPEHDEQRAATCEDCYAEPDA